MGPTIPGADRIIDPAQALQRVLAARAHTVASHIDKAVYTLDGDWCFTYLNPAAERLLGRRWEELTGRSLWDEFPDLVGSELESVFWQAERTREHATFAMFYKPMDRHLSIDVFADELGVSVCFGDTDERQRHIDETAASSHLMRTLLEVLPFSIVIMEADGTILSASRRWRRIREALTESEPMGNDDGNYFDTLQRATSPQTMGQLRERMDALLAGKADDVHLDVCSQLGGEDVWFQVRASRVDETGLAVVTHTDVTSHVRAHHSASWQARHDHLTQLANRAHLDDLLADILDAPDRRPLSLLFIDIDEFKSINDRHGHDVGDDILRAIAKRLQASTRAEDTVVRLGGDEFVIVSHPGSPTDAHRLEERLRSAFDEPFRVGSGYVRIRMSIGVATARSGEDVRQLMRRADLAMYADKRRRGTVR